jgi:hypothetical protein
VARRADWSPPGPRNARPDGRLWRNPPLDGNEEAGYGFAYNPPCELDAKGVFTSIADGRERNGIRMPEWRGC